MTTRTKKQNTRMGEMVIKDAGIAKQFTRTTTVASKYPYFSAALLHNFNFLFSNKS